MRYKPIFMFIYIWGIIFILSEHGVPIKAMEDETGLDAKIDSLAEDVAIQIPKDILFSIELEFQSDFDNRIISDKLRKAFQDNKIQLSNKVKVISLDKKTEKWLIVDENKEYAVGKGENGKLNIYPVKYIAVIDFVIANTKVIAEPGAYITSRLVHRLLKVDRYLKIMERGELEKVLGEYKIEMSDFYDPEKVKKLGKFHGVDAILTGKLWDIETFIQTEASLVKMEDATTMLRAMKPIPYELLSAIWIDMIKHPPSPGSKTVIEKDKITYILPPFKQLTPQETKEPGRLPACEVNYLYKETGIDDLVLLESWLKEIGPVELPQAQWEHPIKCLDALKPVQFAASSWLTDSKLVYAIAGASQIVYNQSRDSYYISIYRWIFFYKGPDSRFLLIWIDPGPEIAGWVSWTWKDEKSKTKNDEETYKDFAPVNISELKVDSYDAIQAVIKHGAIPADGIIFLRMDDIQGKHIPVWFVVFNGTFKVDAATGEIAFSPLKDRIPGISELLQEFRNDKGEQYEVMRMQTDYTPPSNDAMFPKLPYSKYFRNIDFRTRLLLCLEAPEWKTYFYYKTPVEIIHKVPSGASTRKDLTSPILAEAKLTSFGGKKERVIYGYSYGEPRKRAYLGREDVSVCEIHYREDGTKAYEGTINFNILGFKKDEKAIEGTKKAEYYFLWPGGIDY